MRSKKVNYSYVCCDNILMFASEYYSYVCCAFESPVLCRSVVWAGGGARGGAGVRAAECVSLPRGLIFFR